MDTLYIPLELVGRTRQDKPSEVIMMSDNADNKKGGVRVAVIGGGVSGLAAAWHLKVNAAPHHHVELFEAADRLGGHAHTVSVPSSDNTSKIDVDIGFMVYNEQNYPNMVAWFDALNVEQEDSDMSLSVSLDHGRTVEWNSDGLNGLFAKRSQCISPSYYTFIKDMMRFNAEAADILTYHDDDPRKHVTTGQYLRQNGYSHAFCSYYLLPMMAALWSASMEDVYQFPAAQLIGFLCNHKMLQLFDRPQWKTVAGRSQQYTTKVYEVLGKDCAHVSTPVYSVEKQVDTSYILHGGSDNKTFLGAFDHVIFACHPPTAKLIIERGKSVDSKLLELLGNLEYADNVVYVHSDPALMPRRRHAWASWNCLGQSRHLQFHSSQHDDSQHDDNDHKMKKFESFEGGESGFGNRAVTKKDGKNKKNNEKHVHFDKSDAFLEGTEGRMKAVYVTYWLNRLQNLATNQNYFVSLNPHVKPSPKLTHQRLILAHPQFTPRTLQARQQLLSTKDHQGVDNLWFCGAWAGYGFHEDGCRSGFEVATQLSGIPLPWCDKAPLAKALVVSTNGTSVDKDNSLMVLAPPDLAEATARRGVLRRLYQTFSYDLPVAICKRFIIYFLGHAVKRGKLVLRLCTGSNKQGEQQLLSFGDGSPCSRGDDQPVTLNIYDDWFFVKVAMEYDLGLARSYMAGHFVVAPLDNASMYQSVMRPPTARNETTTILGDPIGLTRLFLLLIGNRDYPQEQHVPLKAGRGHWYSNALTNASGLVISKIGSMLNYLRYKLSMDNSERGGSMKNIHAHYDLSNDLFTAFLDKETLMYSSAIYDAVKAPTTSSVLTTPSPTTGLLFKGTLEEAQHRKLDTLLARAQIQPGQKMLDIGFGWGGLSIHAAKHFGCHVTGITLSIEQKALAEERVKAAGVEHLITFHVMDYRTFARQTENQGKFDRVLSCEMIEAVGHEHLGEFFWAVEQVLAQDGILVMEAITTPEQRYETYLRSTDFINTIIFPGSCCPSLHALVDAAYQQSCLTLEHIDNIGLHYAQTLAEWRRRFNANEEFVRSLGFDDIFLRVWNYYLTYCEAGFFSQTENCLILVFARQGCSSLVPLCETRSVTQDTPLTQDEVRMWID